MELDTVDQQLEPYRVVPLWCDLGRCSRTVVVRCGEPLFAPSSSPSLLSFPHYLPSLALSVRGCRALLLPQLAAPFLPSGPSLPLSPAPAPFLGPPPAPPPPPPSSAFRFGRCRFVSVPILLRNQCVSARLSKEMSALVGNKFSRIPLNTSFHMRKKSVVGDLSRPKIYSPLKPF